jgi:hypothetical protein
MPACHRKTVPGLRRLGCTDANDLLACS